MSAANSARSAAIVVLAVVFLAFHLPYLPASLEDLDSVNFALGVRQFDVARHQPHPPGYPVYIAVAKAVRPLVSSELAALAGISVVAGTLGVLAIAALFRLLDEGRRDAMWTTAAVAVAITSPLYWFSAARPLSDMAGLAAAIAVQALTMSAVTSRSFALAAFGAGLATGIRTQVAWLTVPLLILRGLGAGRWGLGAGDWRLGARAERPSPERPASSPQSAIRNPQSPIRNPQSPIRNPESPVPSFRARSIASVAFLTGVAAWFVPLVVAGGGPAPYWHALFDQGAEDFGNIQMLWTTHTPRAVADALYYTWVAPWGAWPVAAIVLVCASAGVAWAWRHGRHALLVLAAAFGPYLLFDLLFQETVTGRYALPLVVPIGWLAAAGLRFVPHDTGLAAAVAVAMFGAHTGGTSIAAYAAAKAPAFRLLDDMAAARSSLPASAQPVLAMDRRNTFDFRRPLTWAGGRPTDFAQVLPAPPQHEWLEAVKYWNRGGRAPVWFVVDPARTSIDLVQHGEPARYRWPLPYPELVSGARPNEMDWYRVERPEWYVEEGWSLTPEAAGVADADGAGLPYRPIRARANRSTLGGTLIIGGRNFDAVPRQFELTIGGVAHDRADSVPPGPFLRFLPVPDQVGSPGEFVPIVVSTTAGSHLAIEQFDVSLVRPLVGYGPGWQEQEFNPRTGARWRWLSERGELEVRATSPRVVLHLEGESPLKYFSRGSRLIVRAGGRALFDQTITADFAIDIPLDAGSRTISLETDQVFSPADRSRRTADRRHLGLRVYRCVIRPL